MKATLPKAPRRTKRSPQDVHGTQPSVHDSALSKLTTDLLHQLLEQSDHPTVRAGLRRAAAEAESLAWLTPVPLLVLPTLLHEKAREARLYVFRQAGLREVTRDWLCLAE
jgi:hypothetical protein